MRLGIVVLMTTSWPGTVWPAAAPALKPTLYRSDFRSSSVFTLPTSSITAACSAGVQSNEVGTNRRDNLGPG